jgi:crossover junction endodeoxyribonuclease RuvC
MRVVNTSYTVLSVDPGYERLGVAVLIKENGKEKLVFSECLQSSKKDTDGVRLQTIGLLFKKIIENYKPDAVAMEKIFFTTNQTTGILVASMSGVIKFLATEAGVPVFEYTPTGVKMAIASHGRATKEDVHQMVSKLVILPEKKRLDDEIDAIAVGLTHLARARLVL